MAAVVVGAVSVGGARASTGGIRDSGLHARDAQGELARDERCAPRQAAPCLPSLASAYLRVRAASWNIASLFGGLALSARRWSAKRQMLERLCAPHDLLLLQGTWGKAADLLTLLTDFV